MGNLRKIKFYFQKLVDKLVVLLLALAGLVFYVIIETIHTLLIIYIVIVGILISPIDTKYFRKKHYKICDIVGDFFESTSKRYTNE